MRPKYKIGDRVIAEVTKGGAKKPACITEVLRDGFYSIRFVNDGETTTPTTFLGQISGWQRHENDLEFVERPVSKFVWLRKVNGKMEEI